MGYRNKIALLDIKTHKKIKSKSYKQLIAMYNKKDEGYLSCYEIADEIYEIGKYWDHNFLKKYQKPVFLNRATHRHFNDESEFYVIGKDGLKAVIESYHQKIADYYQSIITPDPKEVELNWHTTPEAHIKNMINEWKNDFGVKPYNLDPEESEIVSSWKFEYTIFELVRIYKTVDDKKQLICLTGW